MTLSLDDMTQLASDAGFPDPAMAAAIAMVESGGHPQAHGDTSIGSGAGSYGLWQIYIDAHPEYADDPTVLYDPATNAAAAFKVFQQAGGTFKPWSTAWEHPFTSGYLGPNAPFQKYYSPPAPPDQGGGDGGGGDASSGGGGDGFPLFPVLLVLAVGAAALAFSRG